jgi:hypothetical protein
VRTTGRAGAENAGKEGFAAAAGGKTNIQDSQIAVARFIGLWSE